MQYPTVNLAAVEGFLKVYNRGAVYVLFDNKSKQAMVDFANVALKSYVDDLQAKAKQMRAEAMQKAAPVPAPEKPKSSLILTD